MSATTVPVSVRTAQSWARSLRLALVALAVAVLLAASFAIGRATVNTSHGVRTITPTATANATAPSCHFGQPC